MSGSDKLFAAVRHDLGSKTVAREFVDSMLNGRQSILSCE